MVRRALVWVMVGLFTVGASSGEAAEIWTDADGDGLPDTTATSAIIGTPVTFDVWIDSESFSWTNFIVFVEFPTGMSYQSAEYILTDGTNFPIDDFSNPQAIGIGGFGYDEVGVERLASITLQPDDAGQACVAPIIEAEPPYDTYSILQTATSWATFSTTTGSCYDIQAGPGEPDGPDGGDDTDDPPGPDLPSISVSQWADSVALVKVSQSAITLPANTTSLELSRAAIGVDMSASLWSDFDAAGVTRFTQLVPDFDPRIVDRNGELVKDAWGEPLLVPHDMSLWYTVDLNHNDVRDACASLALSSEVLVAEPDYVVRPMVDTTQPPKASAVESRHYPDAAKVTLFPNDPLHASRQWGLHNFGQYCGVAGFDLNAHAGWDISTGEDPSVKLGVLDTGIDPDHPDFAFIELGPNFSANPGTLAIDNDQVFWHGTAVAGIAAMKGNNGIGGAGVAWGVTVVPVKVLTSTGGSIHSRVIQGIEWCRNEGIKVINMSLGFIYEDPGDPTALSEAVRNAHAAGMASVAAAGNQNNSDAIYPAAYSRHVVAVNAFWNTGARWDDTDPNLNCPSQLGSEYASWVDLTAPGGQGIVTTKHHNVDGGYYRLDGMSGDCGANAWCDSTNGFRGTSAAAPYVSGVFAAIMATNPIFDGEDAENLTMHPEMVVDHTQYGLGHDPQSGWGHPDLAAVLSRSTAPFEAERGTATGGTVYDDGTGQVTLYGFEESHGISPGTYAFERKRVEKTLYLTCLDQPLAWGRVQGSVGWRYFTNGETVYNRLEDPGYTEIVWLTQTEMILKTYWYKLRYLSGGPVGDFPNDGNVAMSYTVVGIGPCEPTNVMTRRPGQGAMIEMRPNPASEAVTFRVRSGGARPADEVLTVYDVSGRLVRRFALTQREDVLWHLESRDGTRVANGLYFLQLEGDGRSVAQGKLTVLR